MQKLIKSIPFICYLILTFIVTPYGTYANEENYEPSKPPIITFFEASTNQIKPGETVTLSWKVLAAKEVVITGNEKEIECLLEGALEVWPMTTTEYTLHVYGFFGEEITSKLIVQVGPPLIESFTASSNNIAPGEPIELSWHVKNAEYVTIDQIDDQILPLSSSTIVNPYVDTTYVLTATAYDHSTVTKEVTINVNAIQPLSLTFTADQTEIKKGESVKFTWLTTNAMACSLTSNRKLNLSIPTNGSIALTPDKTTQYTLIAKDKEGNQKEQKIKIKVVKK